MGQDSQGSSVYVDALKSRVSELDEALKTLYAEKQRRIEDSQPHIAAYDRLTRQLESAAEAVTVLEHSHYLDGSPRKMTFSRKKEHGGSTGRPLTLPMDERTKAWEPDGYTVQSTAIRKQMIEDVPKLEQLFEPYMQAVHSQYEISVEISKLETERNKAYDVIRDFGG